MSGEIEAIIGGPAVHEMSSADVEPAKEWANSEHHQNHEYALIFGGTGPWMLCLSCEWSADLPDDVGKTDG